MTKQRIDEQTINDYLLGSLPEAEIERLDELSITDDEFADRLRAAENDLVDAYVRGELSGNNLNKFKSFYLASPKRREKLALAETLRSLIDSESLAKTEPRGSFFAFSRPAVQWIFAAAAIVMLFAGGYLMIENMRLRRQIAQTKEEHSALKQREQELQRRLTQQQSSDVETRNELAQVQEKLAQLEQTLAERGIQPDERSVKVIVFNLSPQLRSRTKIPTLTIPSGTEFIVFTLELEPNDFSAYQAILKNPANDQALWQSNKLKADKTGNKIRLRLPANLLQPQNYLLEISGITTGETKEMFASYPFKVVAK